MRSVFGMCLMACLAMSTMPVHAMEDRHPIALTDAQAAVGSVVLTADDVKLGHLIGVNDQGENGFLCFVQLDRAIRVDTSPLIVAGLLRDEDGTLRLSEDAATLAERMKLPLLIR